MHIIFQFGTGSIFNGYVLANAINYYLACVLRDFVSHPNNLIHGGFNKCSVVSTACGFSSVNMRWY